MDRGVIVAKPIPGIHLDGFGLSRFFKANGPDLTFWLPLDGPNCFRLWPKDEAFMFFFFF